MKNTYILIATISCFFVSACSSTPKAGASYNPACQLQVTPAGSASCFDQNVGGAMVYESLSANNIVVQAPDGGQYGFAAANDANHVTPFVTSQTATTGIEFVVQGMDAGTALAFLPTPYSSYSALSPQCFCTSTNAAAHACNVTTVVDAGVVLLTGTSGDIENVVCFGNK